MKKPSMTTKQLCTQNVIRMSTCKNKYKENIQIKYTNNYKNKIKNNKHIDIQKRTKKVTIRKHRENKKDKEKK